MIPRLELNSGNNIPILGLGTWLSQPGEVKAAVIKAIDTGYRHIDCAAIYRNEKEIGEALAGKFQAGTLKREDIFITSKLWNNDHHPDMVEKACKKTLNDLNLEYLDLYLIHWPVSYKAGGDLIPTDESGNILFSDVDYIETWKAMEFLVDKKLVKSIGLSNFNLQQIQRVLDNARIKPAMLQIEMHPYLPGFKIHELCSKHNILITAYSPLGAPNRPSSVDSDLPVLLNDEKVNEIAKSHNKSASHVLIRYAIQRGIVVIPKSVNSERIVSNFQVFDFELSDAEMKILNSFNVNTRYIIPDVMKPHKYYPF